MRNSAPWEVRYLCHDCGLNCLQQAKGFALKIERTCSTCGAHLPSDAPEGNCPQCLLKLALQSPAVGEPIPPEAPRHQPSAHGRLRYFGDYELLEEIGRGGMGAVYKARQVSLNRLVAVKLLLFGPFASDRYVRRFQAEAEAAASLQHPNIVTIHEVGVHEGQHYFSMDYVEGQDLGERARDNPLPPELAADYLKTIARSIHYAHQHGVLHRDLKPSNVLIDALDQPRVTDFGLAKRLHEDSNLTLSGDLLGTPNYMAPEQARSHHGAISVASDIYSLGAILYYLLTGRPPFLADSVHETLQHVLERDAIAPRVINPNVPRDLQTICLKCLSKQPAARYADAAALAADLDLWQSGKPILARPISRAERLWRWCCRQPALATLILLITGLLACVAIGSSWMLVREKRAREKEARLRQEAQAHSKRAEAEAAKSQQVSRLLETILQSVTQSAALGKDPAFRLEVMKKASAQIGSDLTSDPEVEIALRSALARVYHQLGLYQPMAEMAGENLRLTRTVLKSSDPALPRALTTMGDALMHLGKLDEAEVLCRDGLARREALAGVDDAETAGDRTLLAHILQMEGKLDEAERLCREALATVIRIRGPEQAEVAGVLDNLALVLHDQNRLEAAEDMNRQVLAMRIKLYGAEHEDVATSMHNLARVLYREGRLTNAEALYRDALALRRKLLGNEHSAVGTCLHNLAVVLHAEKRLDEAETTWREAIGIRRKVNGPAHPAVAQSLNGLATALNDQAKSDEAGALWHEALSINQKNWPDDPAKWTREFR